MLALVAIANLIVALFNFYLAWKLQKWRRAIACLAETLACSELNARNLLATAPEFIVQGRKETRALRERYQTFQRQWQQLTQLLALLRFLSAFAPTRFNIAAFPLNRKPKAGFPILPN